MRIGLMIGADGTSRTLDDIVALAKQVESAGLDNVWLANIFSYDAISTLALVGRETSRIGLGTAVTPTYPRHPTAIAQQALTTAAASGGRFTLGIGLSHKIVIENMLGLSYARPARHLREYLSVLMPLVRGERVDFDGETYSVHGLQLVIPGSEGMPVVVAALGPRMLQIAGEMTQGTNTWMVGPNTMESHVVTSLEAAGNAEPTIVGGYPIILTTNVESARERIAKGLEMYGRLPSYRAMLDREGVAGPADIALIGDESHLRGQLERLESIGVTDFNAAIMDVEGGAHARTFEFLASLK
jgi:F420-dependent oxidoreductase-like protein